MSNGEHTSSTAGGGAGQPGEEEMRAAMEEELKRISVDDVLLQTLITLLNLGGRRLGTMPGGEAERDLAQVQAAIEGVRALLPVIERSGAAADKDLGPARDVLSQLQMAYAKLAGESGGEAAGEGVGAEPEAPPAAEPKPGGLAPAGATELGKKGPAQSSGRLWVPGER